MPLVTSKYILPSDAAHARQMIWDQLFCSKGSLCVTLNVPDDVVELMIGYFVDIGHLNDFDNKCTMQRNAAKIRYQRLCKKVSIKLI